MGRPLSCPVCRTPRGSDFFESQCVPVHQNLLLPSPEVARQCDRGDVVLGYCHSCEFIWNVAFDPRLLRYSPRYENSQSFSPTFWAYMQNLAIYLIDRYNLRGKDIVEIGCGKGEFLTLLCELGGNRGVGFDPSYREDASHSHVTAQVKFISDFYSDRYTDYRGDLVCCRHVLEHIQQPVDLLTSFRPLAADRPGSAVFVEVPDVDWILQNLTFWDVFYEHCSYFNSHSLARALTSAGFSVSSVRGAFGGQYLWAEALPDEGKQEMAPRVPEVNRMSQSVEHFVASYEERVGRFRQQIGRATVGGKRCVMWGAGAKGVTFLNVLNIQPQCIPYVVDVNPRKQGMYVPGTGQLVVPPDFLRSYIPDVIIVMNPNYVHEVRETISAMGLTSEVVPVQ
jgi:SAM-dependent methyltransferase